MVERPVRANDGEGVIDAREELGVVATHREAESLHEAVERWPDRLDVGDLFVGQGLQPDQLPDQHRVGLAGGEAPHPVGRHFDGDELVLPAPRDRPIVGEVTRQHQDGSAAQVGGRTDAVIALADEHGAVHGHVRSRERSKPPALLRVGEIDQDIQVAVTEAREQVLEGCHLVAGVEARLERDRVPQLGGEARGGAADLAERERWVTELATDAHHRPRAPRSGRLRFRRAERGDQ